MVNEEIQRSRSVRKAQQSSLASQIADKQRRLNRLFEGLETGHLDFADVAQRIKKLKCEIDALQVSDEPSGDPQRDSTF